MLDSFDNDPPPSKKLKRHKWQQAETWANYCLDILKPGALVWDPMMGGGTLPLVARRRGFSVIGSDVDAEAVAGSVGRLREEGFGV
jgi:adenine-specific DNA methylase